MKMTATFLVQMEFEADSWEEYEAQKDAFCGPLENKGACVNLESEEGDLELE